jgi:hypothetical protein
MTPAHAAPSDSKARRIAVFLAEGFPSIDTPSLDRPALDQALAGLPADRLGTAADLGGALRAGEHAVLVLPYGSAFPVDAWPAIRSFLKGGGSLVALVDLFFFRDTWGFLWWLGALVLIARSRNRLLLSACFVFSTCLEWSGTAIGNWRWAAEVPLVGLHTANPPSGLGILYVLLDLIDKLTHSRTVFALRPAQMRAIASCSSAASPGFVSRSASR